MDPDAAGDETSVFCEVWNAEVAALEEDSATGLAECRNSKILECRKIGMPEYIDWRETGKSAKKA